MSDKHSDVQAITESIGQLLDPETGRKLKAAKQVGEVSLQDNCVRCVVRLTSHSAPIQDEFLESVREHVKHGFPHVREVEVVAELKERRPVPLGEVGLTAKSIIAVGSGKGGVGKSTIATSIALTLAKSGASVGLMDADVYGPSVPHLLGLTGHPEIFDGKMQPVRYEGIPIMSMGFLVKPDEAVVWRGPMLHGSITQFLRDTNWGDLDYLIVDMPPGTGDVALSLSRIVPMTGAVIVCTPQQVALIDAVRAISMFRSIEIPVVGMVENMSGFICPGCDKKYDIFGSGGARAKAEELDVPFLGEVPLNMLLQQQSDTGNISDSLNNPICSTAMERITRNLVRNLNEQAARKPFTIPLPVL